MLDLRDALRDLQDGHESLARIAAAGDLDEYRQAFEQALGHVRGALYQVQRAVRTGARQEPGRPRADAATLWCAREQAAIDADPLLRWARDARGDTIAPEGNGDGATPLAVVVVSAPAEHLGAPLPVSARTPVGLVGLALAYCESRYERALTHWG